MRKWNEFLKSLTRSPRGFNADGRALGLGLAIAMEQSRQNPAADVEEYLRRQANERHTATSS